MGKIRKGIKMRVTPEQSQKVQEICFENGIGWKTGKVLKHLNKPYFYINGDSELGYSDKDSQLFFIEDDREEVSAELFIRTNGTCIESEVPTEDTNKGEQMEELKLECLVEGYEGTYFEVGQVWETRGGERLKVKRFDFKTDIYKLIMSEIEDLDLVRYYSSKGRDVHGRESDFDLVKLISTEDTTETTPTKQSQPKTLSEYLKENNAYESFVENCVEAFLKALEENKSISLNNTFIWEDTKEGYSYWYGLDGNCPKNLIYDMKEIVFAEVDKRLAGQNSKPELEPKILSEYLKENGAYESFIENSVEYFLGDKDTYHKMKLENDIIYFGNTFTWNDTKQGIDYWIKLAIYKPKNLVYDMNEIIFAEVDKRLAEQKAPTEFISTEEFDQMLEQKSSKRYMVFVEGKNTPRYIHETKDSAETEAKRLSAKEIGCNVFVVEIVKEYKSKIIVEEL